MLAPSNTIKGYSLLEMMVVMAIIGVLAAVAVPNFIVWNQKHKLKSDVANLAGTLAFARMTAINQNTPVVVNVSQVLPAPVTVTFASPLGASRYAPDNYYGSSSPVDRCRGGGRGITPGPEIQQHGHMGEYSKSMRIICAFLPRVRRIRKC